MVANNEAIEKPIYNTPDSFGKMVYRKTCLDPHIMLPEKSFLFLKRAEIPLLSLKIRSFLKITRINLVHITPNGKPISALFQLS
jgi:hypothetical protein